ncbi:MAG: hypothetical protein AABX47_07420 [Nanoarchaeota archaeon]
MQKQGQIAAFMIVAVVLIVLLALIIYIAGVTQTEQGQAQTAERNIESSMTSLNEYVTGCLRKSAETGLLMIGAQGGYVYPEVPPGYIEYADARIHYGYLLGYNTVPSREDVAKYQLGRYILETVPDCTGEFTQFSHLGQIATKEAETQININDNNIVINMRYPITISTPYHTSTVSDFSMMLPVRLGHMIDIEDEISARTVLNPNWIELTWLDSLDVKATGTPLAENKVLYSLTDLQSKINGVPYVYQFAMLLSNNSAPEMLPIRDMTVRAGETKTFTVAGVDFANQEIKYRIESAIAVIDEKTGIITIKPGADDIGTYLTVVHARNAAGLETTQLFFIEVTR